MSSNCNDYRIIPLKRGLVFKIWLYMKKIWQPLIKNFTVYIVETCYILHHYICFNYSYCFLGKRCGPLASNYENILRNVNLFIMERQKKKSKTPVQRKYLSFKVSTIIIDRMDQSKNTNSTLWAWQWIYLQYVEVVCALG